jgi:hypothetical protein
MTFCKNALVRDRRQAGLPALRHALEALWDRHAPQVQVQGVPFISFQVTSGTIFASRKLDFTDLLGAICICRECREGPFRSPAFPRSGRPVQDGIRARSQAA